MIKLHKNSAVALRENGSIDAGPVPFDIDIIDAMVADEKRQQVSAFPVSGQPQIKLSQYNGFSSQSARTLELPLKTTNRMSYCADILRDDNQKRCESMFCVEFDL